MTPRKLKFPQELSDLGDVQYFSKPKKTLLVEAIAAMNISALKILLDDDKTYINTTKEVFLNGLEILFEDFKRSGNTQLLVNNGSCSSKHCTNCGVKGYRFVGNNFKDYFDFVFEMEGEEVKEISDCFLFETDIASTDLAEPFFIEINYDDRNDFEKTSEYWEFFNATQTAYSEIITTPPILLDSERLDGLLEKFADLNQCIIGNDEYYGMQMKWDNFLSIYVSLESIRTYISTHKIEILLANNLLEQIKTEQDLIDWVLRYKTIYDYAPFELTDYFVKQGKNFSCKLSDIVNFTGEPFNQVFNFITSYKKHEKELLDKYNTYTEEEYNEAHNSEEHLNKGIDLFSLQFHMKKRMVLSEIGITLPFYLGKV